MRTELVDYPLPEGAIAQYPSPERDGARLLEVSLSGLTDRRVREWPGLVPPGALVVLNRTRVIRARLLGIRVGTGGKAEIFLLRRQSEAGSVERWQALGRASKALRAGSEILSGSLRVKVLEQREGGELLVELRADGGLVADAVETLGHVPLPPYVRRPDEPSDKERYQTVFADSPGSAAAPTAGLHLTRAGLAELESRGVDVGYVTLHVSVGTFRPVTVEDLDEHPMHEEHFEVDARLAAQVRAARLRGAPVVAVGTTVVRALESAALADGSRTVREAGEATRLLIQPGYRFQVVDGLLTNFHQPRSTLLALVAAFVGLERQREAYRVALESNYRFLSYGDAMWIPEVLA